MIAQNAFHMGEAWPHLASGTALREKYQLGCYHKTKDMDDDWWLRHNDRMRVSTVEDAGTFYYNEAPLLKKCFKASVVKDDHSMKVFRQMAKTGFKQSFSETNLQSVKEDLELRKEMKRRYNEVMKRKGSASPSRPVSIRGSPSKTMLDAARTWSGEDFKEKGVFKSSGSAVAGPPVAKVSPDEQSATKKLLKQPKWGSADATPKAELRSMSTGRRIVVLPNSRLMLNEKVPDPVHSAHPPRRPRGGMIPAMIDYEGEGIMY